MGVISDEASSASVCRRIYIMRGLRMRKLVRATLEEHMQVVAKMAALEADIVSAGEVCADALLHGYRIYLCGNGGSAADAQHIAAELIGRFVSDRRSLPAIALTTD